MFPCIGRRLLLLSRQAAAAAASSYRHASLVSSSPPLQTPKPSSFSHSPSITNPKPDPSSPTFAFLVASCGLSPDAALRASRHFSIKSTVKADAVLALLRSYGFSDAQISKLVGYFPLLLTLDPDKILKPKLDFFVGLGFAGPSLPKLVAREPSLLGCSMEKQLVPCVHFLRGILRTDADIVAAVSNAPRALTGDPDKVMRPAVEALRRHGLLEEAISWLVLSQMRVLASPPDRIREIVEALQAAGVQPSDGKRFLRCFRVLCNLNRSTWERKIALYKNFGFSGSEVLKVFRTQPTTFALSDENIQKKLCFFLDKLKLTLAHIIACPQLLGRSFENTILPRCAVLGVLMREGKISRDIHICTPLVSNAKVFLERYVSKYQHDVPDVLKAYEGKMEFKGFPLKSRDTVLVL